MIPNWSHPNPIFLDFETQSACDIKEQGGRLYAEHASTRVLILVMAVDDVFHVWIPDHIRVDVPNPTRLWPYTLKPSCEVRLYRGKDFPEAMQECLDPTRPLVAHNAYGFDRIIWERFCPGKWQWLDSMLLAKIAGRPGRLDALGKAILGVGKDRASKLLPILTTATESNGIFEGSQWSYPHIKPGDLQAFTTYAIADVEILRRLWNEFEDLNVEADVIATHDAINQRGVAVDVDLLDTIERLSEYTVNLAVNDIEKMTRGRINANNIRSTKQIHEWLGEYGVTITDDNGKPCLRKEIVQRFIDSPYVLEENLSAATEIPLVVTRVMQLRLKALRITDAKVKRAKQRVGKDGRIRDLHSYHQAHTGRWSSSGVQIHNLPRSPKPISDNLQKIIDEISSLHSCNDVRLIFDRIKELIPTPERETDPPYTVDDLCSAMIRPSFIAPPGKRLVLCDFEQVEARAAAWAADERKLLDIFLAGRDPYREFAAEMFGVPLDMVTADMRQIAKSAVLGCQFGLGPDKFRVYAANNGADLVAAGVTAEFVIEKYRNAYTRICGFKPDPMSNFRTDGVWHRLDNAVKTTVGTGESTSAAKCRFHLERKNLVCVLPSGRCLFYPDARIEDVVPGYCYSLNLPLVPKATVVYTSPRGPKSLYGGLIFENVIQGMCRDMLALALNKLEYKEFNPVMHVHDEPVCEVDEDTADDSLTQIVSIMSEVPEWAPGFPMSCEGFVSPRFVKKKWKGFKSLSTKELKRMQ